MKTETFKASAATAYGKNLSEPIKFDVSYEAYETVEEIPAKEALSPEEILTVVNNRRKASATQAARTAALDAAGIVKPTNEDPQVALSNMVKILVAQGKSEVEATALAKTVLGQ